MIPATLDRKTNAVYDRFSESKCGTLARIREGGMATVYVGSFRCFFILSQLKLDN